MLFVAFPKRFSFGIEFTSFAVPRSPIDLIDPDPVRASKQAELARSFITTAVLLVSLLLQGSEGVMIAVQQGRQTFARLEMYRPSAKDLNRFTRPRMPPHAFRALAGAKGSKSPHFNTPAIFQTGSDGPDHCRQGRGRHAIVQTVRRSDTLDEF